MLQDSRLLLGAELHCKPGGASPRLPLPQALAESSPGGAVLVPALDKGADDAGLGPGGCYPGCSLTLGPWAATASSGCGP